MPAASREVVDQLLRAARTQDIEAFTALLAPDASIEWPFRPPGVPARVQGRAEIRRHLTAAAGGFIRLDEHRNVVIHETTDPEVTIVEYEAHGTVVPTGAPFHQTLITVFQVRAGLVLSCRDYLNPLPLAEALATLPAR